MASDNKISLDVTINADGERQIKQYQTAFDGLRSSINNLSNPITKLDSDISELSDSINKLGSENNGLIGTIEKIKKSSETAGFVIETLKKAFDVLKTGVISLEEALTGGLTILIAYGPEIINFAKALFKGKDAINQAKLSMDTLNKGISSTEYSKAIENVDTLKIKVDLAKKGFIQKSEVVKEYNGTLGQTIGQVKTLDQVETSLKNNAGNYIKMMLAKATAMAALKEAADNQVLAAKELNKSDEDSVSYMMSGLPKDSKEYKNDAEKNRRDAARPFETKAKKFQNIAEHYMVDVSNFNKQIENNSPINIIKKQIDDLQKLSDAKIVNSKTFKKIKLLKKELKDLETPSTDYNYRSAQGNSSGSKPQKAIQAQAEQFAMRADVRKKQMDTELADFDKQLKAELITQEQHNDLSKQANEKFLAGLRADIGDFSAESINEVLQYQKELVKSKKLGEDQHDVDKALLPTQKLAAEKKLIEDKYNFEIQAANEAGKGTTAIRMRYAQEMVEADKKFAQERKDFELKTTQEVSNAAFSILQNSIKSQSEAKIKQLETQKTSELNNSSLTSSQKKAIEEKYAKKEAEEKTKAFKAEQKASILQAVINGALAITKVTAQTGVASAFIIPGIIAETAIQVATIAAQKAPQYAKGGVHYQSDGRGALLPGYSRTDNMNAYLRSGEAVVVSEAMRDPWARNLVSAINVAYGGRDFSMANPHRGYAIGGIFTDGGNSNRYYNQPMNDQKDLANTIAYQMINNFPPVYVDVKDINTQQSILAQTINRVNL